MKHNLLSSLALFSAVTSTTVSSEETVTSISFLRGNNNKKRQQFRNLSKVNSVLVDNFNSEFDPSDPNSNYFYFGIPDIFLGNDGDITIKDKGGVTFTAKPHTLTIETGPLGGVDHVKTLQYRKEAFPSSKGNSVLCEIQMSASYELPDELPAIFASGVTDRDDDIRLASSAMNAIDFETFIVADIFLTNTGIWALNERLPFGWGTDLDAPNGDFYAAYSQVKKIGDRVPTDIHNLAIEYNKADGAIRWYVEGELKAETTTIGTQEASFTTLLDHGGTAVPVIPNSMNFGFGMFTLLDFKDPNNPTSDVGLVKLNPTPGFYASPSTFLDEDSAESSRLFGQGSTMTVYKLKITDRA